MNGYMSSWSSGMGYGSSVFGALILAAVAVATAAFRYLGKKE